MFFDKTMITNAAYLKTSHRRSNNILHKNPTNALTVYTLTTLYSHCNTPTCFSPQEPSSGSTNMFHEAGQQNMCLDVNSRLNSSYRTEASW